MCVCIEGLDMSWEPKGPGVFKAAGLDGTFYAVCCPVRLLHTKSDPQALALPMGRMQTMGDGRSPMGAHRTRPCKLTHTADVQAVRDVGC